MAFNQWDRNGNENKKFVASADGNSAVRVSEEANFSYQVSAKGTVGVNLDVTPTLGMKTAYSFVVNAPLAADDATLKIYNDSVAAENLVYDGYMISRDSNGKVIIPNGATCTTKWIVAVSGGSGTLIAEARYR